MSELKISQKEREILCSKIQDYCYEELDHELGQFDAGFLMDFFAEQLGPYFYNKGIQDVQSVLSKSFDGITEAIYEIEKPVDFSR